jgi:hypothetical protein
MEFLEKKNARIVLPYIRFSISNDLNLPVNINTVEKRVGKCMDCFCTFKCGFR